MPAAEKVTEGLKSNQWRNFNPSVTFSVVRYRELLVADMTKAMAAAPSAIEFIRSASTQVANETGGPLGRRGCLLMNTAAEFAQRDRNIANCVKTGVLALREVFIEAVAQAQSTGDIASKDRPAALADYLVTTLSGLKTQVKAGASNKQVLRIAELSLAGLQRLE